MNEQTTDFPDDLDRSEAADAQRFRWILQGNGYFMEEQMLCGPWTRPEDELEEADRARREIDKMIEDNG